MLESILIGITTIVGLLWVLTVALAGASGAGGFRRLDTRQTQTAVKARHAA